MGMGKFYTVYNACYYQSSAFSALMPLGGWQEEHTACNNWVVGCWRGYLYGARCKWFAYGPADATNTPSSLAPVKSRMVYLSGTGLSMLSWKKGRLNRCSSSSYYQSILCIFMPQSSQPKKFNKIQGHRTLREEFFTTKFGIQGPQECILVMPMHSNHWATSIKKTKLQMILLYLIGDNNTDVDNC